MLSYSGVTKLKIQSSSERVGFFILPISYGGRYQSMVEQSSMKMTSKSK